MKHTNSGKCVCKPLVAFNFGERYGKIYIHATDSGDYAYPAMNAILSAVKRALRGIEVHLGYDKEENQ